MKTIIVPKGQSFRSFLSRLNACPEAREWVGRRSLRTAWRLCEQPAWMFWLAGRCEVDRRLIVLAACDCARTALPHVPAGEDRPRTAIDTAEAWTRGEATLDQVRSAYAAYAASAAYAYADAASAAYASAYAAASASASANAAASAANAAASAAYASAYAAYAAAAYAAYAAAYAAYTSARAAYDASDARTEAHRQMAVLIRARIPVEMIGAGLRGAK